MVTLKCLFKVIKTIYYLNVCHGQGTLGYIKYTRKRSVFFMLNENRCVDMGMPQPRPEMHHFQAEKHQTGEHHHEKHHGHHHTMHHGMNCNVNLPGMECEPIVECPQEKICHRQINHQVRHIQPVHTRIINHHIYNHCCTPHFTCSEENVCCHVWDPCCKPRV